MHLRFWIKFKFYCTVFYEVGATVNLVLPILTEIYFFILVNFICKSFTFTSLMCLERGLAGEFSTS